MNATTLHRSKHILTLAGAALFAASLILISAGSANAFPKSQVGDRYCIAHNDYDQGLPRYPGLNSCCWNEGDFEFCIKCDSNWKNCEYTDAISTPRFDPKKTYDGPLHQATPKPGPKIKLHQLPKNGEVLR